MSTDAGPGAPGLPRVRGHEELLERIRGAVSNGRMPQSLLLHGGVGVGKRTLALWTAALLHCDGPEPPCGTCRSCRLAGRLEHPDIHLHFPMPRPKRASSRKKLRESIETQRQERLARLREEPETPLDEDEVTGIYLTAVENIREQASRRPAMGRIAVFVIADAEAMVPQSASPEAANAFLKLLEEPPDFAYLMLTSSRPSSLLPTIRSRTAPLRVPPLREDDVVRYLIDARELGEEEARSIARRAEGSIGRAIRIAGTEADGTVSLADRMLGAALRGDARSRYAAAGEFGARGARSILAPALDGLEERLRDLLCVAASAGELARDRPTSARILDRWPIQEESVLRALRAVEEAREGAIRNLNPQATVSVLLADMSDAFGGAARP